jgi:hypothetical protein
MLQQLVCSIHGIRERQQLQSLQSPVGVTRVTYFSLTVALVLPHRPKFDAPTTAKLMMNVMMFSNDSCLSEAAVLPRETSLLWTAEK